MAYLGGILCKIDLFLVWSIIWFSSVRFFGYFFPVLMFACPTAESFFKRICNKTDDEKASHFVIVTPFALGMVSCLIFGGGVGLFNFVWSE